jgi:WhiB family transcriptional regulator, redox-sensing transcriptional regulator
MSATRIRLQVGGFLLTQRHRGACTEQTASLFFDDGRGSKARHKAAKAICRLCPILYDCRAYAHGDPTLEGIWGGETHDERRAARRSGTRLPAGDNQEGRRLAGLAAEHARRSGLPAAARAFNVPPATLRRVLGLYGLQQPPDPAGPPAPAKGGEPPWPPSAHRPPAATTNSSRRRSSRSWSSSSSRAGPRPGPAAPSRPMTLATRPPDPPPIPHESPLPAARPKERT